MTWQLRQRLLGCFVQGPRLRKRSNTITRTKHLRGFMCRKRHNFWQNKQCQVVCRVPNRSPMREAHSPISVLARTTTSCWVTHDHNRMWSHPGHGGRRKARPPGTCRRWAVSRVSGHSCVYRCNAMLAGWRDFVTARATDFWPCWRWSRMGALYHSTLQ